MKSRQQTPDQILAVIYDKAMASLQKTVIADAAIRERIDYVCRCTSNRAGVRLLMACLLGKLHNPQIDPRKPYTEIGGNDSFSGRTYDERYLTKFINEHRLPVNPTTAFLTPTLRNIDHALTTDRELIGRPRDLYKQTLQLLEDVAKKRVTADLVFVETVRVLLQLRDEKLARMASLIAALERTEGALPLSSEAIVTLISQHLACKNSSRLPVLIVAAAYEAAGTRLGGSALQRTLIFPTMSCRCPVAGLPRFSRYPQPRMRNVEGLYPSPELEPLRVFHHAPLFQPHCLLADFRLRDTVNAPVFERPVIYPFRAASFFKRVIFRLAP